MKGESMALDREICGVDVVYIAQQLAQRRMAAQTEAEIKKKKRKSRGVKKKRKSRRVKKKRKSRRAWVVSGLGLHRMTAW